MHFSAITLLSLITAGATAALTLADRANDTNSPPFLHCVAKGIQKVRATYLDAKLVKVETMPFEPHGVQHPSGFDDLGLSLTSKSGTLVVKLKRTLESVWCEFDKLTKTDNIGIKGLIPFEIPRNGINEAFNALQKQRSGDSEKTLLWAVLSQPNGVSQSIYEFHANTLGLYRLKNTWKVYTKDSKIGANDLKSKDVSDFPRSKFVF